MRELEWMAYDELFTMDSVLMIFTHPTKVIVSTFDKKTQW